MRNRGVDLAMSGALGLLGAVMTVYSVRYGVFEQGGRIGPGFMPFVAGLALAVFSAWACGEIVIRDWRAARARAGSVVTGGQEAAVTATSGESATEAKPVGAQTNRKVVLVFALTLVAAVLTSLTGFLVAFGLLVLVLLAVVEREPLWLAASVSVAAVAVSWLVFVRLLGVPLPGGVLHLLGS